MKKLPQFALYTLLALCSMIVLRIVFIAVFYDSLYKKIENNLVSGHIDEAKRNLFLITLLTTGKDGMHTRFRACTYLYEKDFKSLDDLIFNENPVETGVAIQFLTDCNVNNNHKKILTNLLEYIDSREQLQCKLVYYQVLRRFPNIETVKLKKRDYCELQNQVLVKYKNESAFKSSYTQNSGYDLPAINEKIAALRKQHNQLCNNP